MHRLIKVFSLSPYLGLGIGIKLLYLEIKIITNNLIWGLNVIPITFIFFIFLNETQGD
tara:strand:- start:211 stop:384 length:174 start_codon:yes stop_codon:yes gene_type:complete